jgi:hypothetical protein
VLPEPSCHVVMVMEPGCKQRGWLHAGGRAAEQLPEQQDPPREVPLHVLRCEPVSVLRFPHTASVN